MAVLGDFSFSVGIPGLPSVPTPTPPNLDATGALLAAGASLLPPKPAAPVRAPISIAQAAVRTTVQMRPSFLALRDMPPVESALSKFIKGNQPPQAAPAPAAAPAPVYERSVRMSDAPPSSGPSTTMIAAGVAVAGVVAFLAFRKKR